MTNKAKDWEVCFVCDDDGCTSCQDDCSCIDVLFEDPEGYYVRNITDCQTSYLSQQLAEIKNLNNVEDIFKLNSDEGEEFMATVALYVG